MNEIQLTPQKFEVQMPIDRQVKFLNNFSFYRNFSKTKQNHVQSSQMKSRTFMEAQGSAKPATASQKRQ